ncbi:MAG: SoxR reducing system RseC family protein [Pseudomonadota bacterium]
MIETPARVTRTEGAAAWVVGEAPSSCGACGGKGCGSSVFNRVWHPDAQEYPVANPIGAQPGDAVVVGLPDGSLLLASTRAYLLPLLALLLGAGLGRLLGGDAHGEPASALGGLIGLLLAALWLRRQRHEAAGEPVILRHGATQCAGRH